jgi:erythrin-vacuolar iron transport family protein
MVQRTNRQKRREAEFLSKRFLQMSKLFADLDEREILALAISLEEEDSRIYLDFIERLKTRYPETSAILQSMYEEELSHFTRLKALFHQRFGNHLPLVRRQDVKGFLKRNPIWLELTLKPRRVLSTVLNMEAESRRFYQDALNKVTSADIRQLLDDLAAAEEDHQDLLVDKTKEKKKTGAFSAEQYSR